MLFSCRVLTAALLLAQAGAVPKALEGRWVIETVVCNGIEAQGRSDVPFSPRTLAVEGRRLTVQLAGGKRLDFGLEADESVTPKQLDATGASGHALRGIYAVDGDTLMICVRMEDNGKRPTAFLPVGDDRTYLFFLRRQR